MTPKIHAKNDEDKLDFENINIFSANSSEAKNVGHNFVPAESSHKPTEANTYSEIIRAWPKTTACIVSNEFCERFSFYGMRTVLVIYLWNYLGFSQSVSSLLFNGFIVLCYFSPLLGSIVADGYLGKFKTILWVSLLYAAGQVVLAAASILDRDSSFHPYVDILGLVIIALGTGGIKPCVASFGGDQFEPHQYKMISIFFSVFYFSINAGSMISTFITPIFRAESCFGHSTCFPLAFGVPAMLMIIAVVVFLLGSPWYKKYPPKENIFAQVFHVTTMALANRSNQDATHLKKRNKNKGEERHWLDCYLDTHDCAKDKKCSELRAANNGVMRTNARLLCHKRQFVADLKSLMRTLVMFLPVPVFWALYDQQGSRWVIQSFAMDCRLWNGWSLIPDQMQTLNAVLILAFIPLFQIIIYPLVECCFKLTALRKMVGGGILAAISFFISAAVQYHVNDSLPMLPSAGNGFVSVMNTFDNCTLKISSPSAINLNHGVLVEANTALINDNSKKKKELLELSTGTAHFRVEYSGGADCRSDKFLTQDLEYTVAVGQTHYLQVGPNGALFELVDSSKATTGKGDFSLSIVLGLTDISYSGSLALCHIVSQSDACHLEELQELTIYSIGTYDKKSRQFATFYKREEIQPGFYNLYYLNEGPKILNNESAALSTNDLLLGVDIDAQGGVYVLWVGGTKAHPKPVLFQVTPPNGISIAWQVPQIVVITASEILLSISGLEFAYSQAAPSMKSLVQACWLLTSAFGDCIIVFIALVNIPNMAIEFLFYAVLMLIVILVFALLAIFYYEYRDNDEEKDHQHYALDDDTDDGGGARPEEDRKFRNGSLFLPASQIISSKSGTNSAIFTDEEGPKMDDETDINNFERF